MFTMRAMKTYRSAQTQGFFDVELRVPWLEAKDNPLSRLDTVIDWEGFRPLLEQALAEPPAKQRQKDVDARWTKKNAEVHYGDKNNLKADAQSKLIERYAVTDASMHDSQSATGSGGPCACGKAAEGCRSPRRSRVKFTREPRRQGFGLRQPSAAIDDDLRRADRHFQPPPRTRLPQPPFERRAESLRLGFLPRRHTARRGAYGSERKQPPEVQASRAHLSACEHAQADRTHLWLHKPIDERILPALLSIWPKTPVFWSGVKK